MSFDRKCYELANHFLPVDKWSSDDITELAELIQRTIDNFMLAREDEVSP